MVRIFIVFGISLLICLLVVVIRGRMTEEVGRRARLPMKDMSLSPVSHSHIMIFDFICQLSTTTIFFEQPVLPHDTPHERRIMLRGSRRNLKKTRPPLPVHGQTLCDRRR